MSQAFCTAPQPTYAASCTVDRRRSLTLEERIRLDPTITGALSDDDVLMHAPIGSMLFVDYTSGRAPSPRHDAAAARPDGMPRSFYFGRIISRERQGSRIVFRLLCTLTRGGAGELAPRTFSTRTGAVHAVRFMELPRPVEGL